MGLHSVEMRGGLLRSAGAQGLGGPQLVRVTMASIAMVALKAI